MTFLAGNRRFVFNRLPMGLATSPAARQHLVQEALAPLRSSVYVSWLHVDDLLFVDSPERLCAIASLVSALLAQWNFVGNTAKSQLTPCTVVNYLGLTLDFDSRSYKPLDAHVRAFFRIASSVSDSSPWARKEVWPRRFHSGLHPSLVSLFSIFRDPSYPLPSHCPCSYELYNAYARSPSPPLHRCFGRYPFLYRVYARFHRLYLRSTSTRFSDSQRTCRSSARCTVLPSLRSVLYRFYGRLVTV